MQNLISLGGVPKIPPSELGFVCKPEMPPHINILFRARPPMPFIPLQQRCIRRNYTGLFDNNMDIMFRLDKDLKQIEVHETKLISKLKSLAEQLEKQKEINREKLKEWEPKSNPNATKDPYKTLFVYRLDPKIDEKTLQKEFESLGEIRKVRVVRDLEGKNRGYAFIEFKHSSDFKYAKNQSKKKIKKGMVYIDYERGRTEKGWKPKRFGGGKGSNRSMPKWLVEQLDFIKKKYPELVKEKGEISDGQLLGNKKRRSNDKEYHHRDRNNDQDNNDGDENHYNDNHNNTHEHYQDDDDDDKTVKEETSSINGKDDKMSVSKKEYEVGEIV